MRILRVAQTIYPESKGGGAYHVHAMSRDQAAMGHDVTVLTPEVDGTRPHLEERDGFTILRYPVTARLFGNDISIGVASYLMGADDFDVIHAHSHLYFSSNLAALKRSLGGPPLAITNHGLYSQNAPEWLFDLYLRSIGRWTFDQADVIFCYTSEDRRRIQALGVESRIDVIPNGIDTKQFTPDGPQSDQIAHDGPVVLFVGRLVEGKRPADAVNAIDKIPDTLNAKIYVVGDGPLKSELESIAGDRVTFLGQVSYDDMPAVYRAADVLVLPSRAEGLPRTVLEAFASEVPVISSDLDQLGPIVNKGGKTVTLGNVEGYATAITDVLRTSTSYSGLRELVRAQNDWRDTVEETTATLQELAKRG